MTLRRRLAFAGLGLALAAIAIEIPRSRLGRWRALPVSPLEGRMHYASAVIGTKVMIWGGLSCEGGKARYFSDGAMFDLHTWRWTKMSPSPIKPCHVALARTFGNRILIIAGDDNVDPIDAIGFADVAWYDPARDAWHKVEDCPITNRWRREVWTENGIVIWQEPDEQREFAGAVFDISTSKWTRMKPCPLSPRRFPEKVLIGSVVFVWGGQSVPDESALADGALYDFARDEWKMIARSPLSGRAFADAYTLGSRVAVWGGHTGKEWTSGAMRDGALYDPERDAWSPLPVIPELSAFPSLSEECNNRISDDSCMVWGEDGVAVFTIGAPTWRMLPKLPFPAEIVRRIRVRRVFRLGTRVLVTGWIGYPSELTGAWFDPSRNTWHQLPRFEMNREFIVTPRGLLLWGGGDPGYRMWKEPLRRSTSAFNDGAFWELPSKK